METHPAAAVERAVAAAIERHSPRLGDGCGSSSGSRRPTPRRYARRSQAYVREAEVSPASDFPQRFPGSGRTRRRGRWWWQVGEHDGDQVLQPEDGPERLPGSPASV